MVRFAVLLFCFFAAFAIEPRLRRSRNFPRSPGASSMTRICSMRTIARPSKRSSPISKTKRGASLWWWTLPSLQGFEIEDFGYRLGRNWGIGEKDKNTGALLIVAPNEHRVRIEVATGSRAR
jgi:uncharacterized protein